MRGDLTRQFDEGGLLVANSCKRLAVADDIDDCRIESDGNRFHLVKRPLVWLVVLTGRREDRKLAQRTADSVFPPDVDTRPVRSDGGRAVRRTESRLGVKRRGQQQRQDQRRVLHRRSSVWR